MRIRILFASIIAIVAVLQAWDSGVFRAGTPVIALVVVGIALLVVAVLLGAAHRAGVPALIAGAILIVTARVLSPVGLNALFIIFPIATMPFLFELIQRQRKQRDS